MQFQFGLKDEVGFFFFLRLSATAAATSNARSLSQPDG